MLPAPSTLLLLALSNGTLTSTASLLAGEPGRVTTCSAAVPPGGLTLDLVGMEWSGWRDLCDRFARYLLRDGRSMTRELPERSERLLRETGYFSEATCTATLSAARLHCAVRPAPMVRDFEVSGRLPFVILEDDLRRQVFLRPGTTLDDWPGAAKRQERRLTEHLGQEGFFGSRVELSARPASQDAPPNAGVSVEARVWPGRDHPLGAVVIDGPSPLPASEIEERLRHHWVLRLFPRRFTPEQLQEDVEALTEELQEAGWPEVWITTDHRVDEVRGAVDVLLRIRPGPKVVLRFEGATFLDAEDLAEQETFTEAGSADSVEIERTAGAIRQRYQGEGFHRARVTPEVAAPGEGEGPELLEVTFHIEEGPRREISSVTLSGCRALDAEDVRSQATLETKASSLFSKGRWVDERIRRDEAAIRDVYRLAGYAATSVGAEGREVGPSSLAVVFHIDEGPRRVVGRVTFSGLPPEVPEADARAVLGLSEGTAFVEAELGADRRALLSLLAARGYPEVKVDRRLAVPWVNLPGEATIEYRVQPGRRAIFAGYFVRGAFQTDEAVIEDELQLQAGDPLDLVALGEARRRLRALGVFGSVELRPLDRWLGDEETWLLVDVEERRQVTLDVVLSFATDDLFALGLDFRDANFLGRAIRFEVSSRLSNASEILVPEARIGDADELRVGLQVPRPFGLPADVDAALLYRLRRAAFTERRLGATFGVSRALLEEGRCALCPEVSARLGYELLAVEGGLSTDLDQGTIPIARVVPSLQHRRLDSLIDPRNGYTGAVRFELASIYLALSLAGATSFWRFLASESVYLELGTPFRVALGRSVSLGGPVVVALGADYGVAQAYGVLGRLPLSESMYYGGDLSVRGISERASVLAFPGANYRVIGNLELRWYSLDTALGPIQLAWLMDLGAVSNRLGALLDDPAITTGAAVRWVTPVGPLSIAYALPLRLPPALAAVPEVASPSGRLHLYFGYGF